MKLYAPSYYKNFSCIADKCRHSCCVGWEIDIDSKTEEKYSLLTHGYGEKIKESILCADNSAHFCLCENGKCPHLDEYGLCRIITELGEDYLCDICREHPRFYNLTKRGKEVGLGMACEEACRILLSSDGYDDFIEIGESCEKSEVVSFDTAVFSDRIYAILKDKELTYSEALEKIYSEFSVSPNILSERTSYELISSLEYLNKKSKKRFLKYSARLTENTDIDNLMRRALAYFVYRHVSPARDESELKTSLGLALFLERLLFSVAFSEKLYDTEAFISLARTVSEEIEYSEDNCDAIKLEFIFNPTVDSL